jgi:glycosyltransferase involved in cell wall biosynthesis
MDNNGSKKTILHLIDALNNAGAQQLLVLFAKWAPHSRYRQLVGVLQPDLELEGELISQGVRVISFNRKRPSILQPFPFCRYFYQNIRDIIALCRENGVDVLQCHLSDAEFTGIIAGRLCHGVKILSTIHGPDIFPPRHRFEIRNVLRFLSTKMLYRWTDLIIAVSDEVAEYLTRIFGLKPEKVRVVLNRIEVSAFERTEPAMGLQEDLGIDRTDRVLTNVGRLRTQKGQTFLLDAMASLVSAFDGIKLLILGEGDLLPMLKRKLEELGLSDRVKFLGNRSDVPDILALTELFVFPSLWEGTSLALLEAMAAGKPIVATDIPGNRTVLQHMKTAFLVPPGDSAALAEGIAFLLTNPAKAKELGHNARLLVQEQFDIRQTIAELEAIWG